jgi:hypothetical protein
MKGETIEPPSNRTWDIYDIDKKCYIVNFFLSFILSLFTYFFHCSVNFILDMFAVCKHVIKTSSADKSHMKPKEWYNIGVRIQGLQQAIR